MCRLPLSLQCPGLFNFLRTRTIFQPLEVRRDLIPLGLGTLEIILKIALVKSGENLSCLDFVSFIHEQRSECAHQP